MNTQASSHYGSLQESTYKEGPCENPSQEDCKFDTTSCTCSYNVFCTQTRNTRNTRDPMNTCGTREVPMETP